MPMTTAAIRRLAIPTPVELIDRARSMAPEIRALAEETDFLVTRFGPGTASGTHRHYS